MATVKRAQNREGIAKPKAKPRGRPFPPGNNANPQGRPKKDRALTAALETTVDKKKLGEKLWALALAGKMDAIKYIYDRIEGTPTVRHEFSVEDFIAKMREERPDLTEEQGNIIAFRARELAQDAG